MWPRQSPAYEWLRLLRFANNDKQRQIGGVNPTLHFGKGETIR